MTIWTTKEGRRVRVRDMEDQHLLNSIAMVHREKDTYISRRVNNLKIVLASPDLSPAESYVYEEEMERLLANDINWVDAGGDPKVVLGLLKEAVARKLELPVEVPEIYRHEVFS